MSTPDDITGPMNLGGPVEFTIRQLADEVIAMTRSASGLVFKSLPSDDPKQRQPDISFAKETLGWEPKTALREGLKKTIVCFDETLKNGD